MSINENTEERPKSGVPYKNHKLKGKTVKVIDGYMKGKKGVVVSVYPWGKDDLLKIDVGSMRRTFSVSIDYVKEIPASEYTEKDAWKDKK